MITQRLDDQKFSLQEAKNKEYDKVVDFFKEFQTKENKSDGWSQKSEIETMKRIVSNLQFKQENSNDEMKQLKGRVDQIETKMSGDHHHIVKRQKSVINNPNNITTRLLPCTPKIPCAFDFKEANVSAASSDKMATSTPSSAASVIPPPAFFL